MPDITMCKSKYCELRQLCYRHEATPSMLQSYFYKDPYNSDGTCNYFMKIYGKDKSKNAK